MEILALACEMGVSFSVVVLRCSVGSESIRGRGIRFVFCTPSDIVLVKDTLTSLTVRKWRLWRPGSIECHAPGYDPLWLSPDLHVSNHGAMRRCPLPISLIIGEGKHQ